MPGGTWFVIEAAVPLLIYSVVIFLAPKSSIVGPATVLGLTGGTLQVVHMVLENFGSRIGEKAGWTLAFMLAGFVTWAAAGYWVAYETGRCKAAIWASCWAAMVCVLIAVTFGLVLMSANYPPASYVATWDEFKRSGWTNAQAFSIANTFDAVLSHLVIGPVVGMFLGFCAVGVARMFSRPRNETFLTNR